MDVWFTKRTICQNALRALGPRWSSLAEVCLVYGTCLASSLPLLETFPPRHPGLTYPASPSFDPGGSLVL